MTETKQTISFPIADQEVALLKTVFKDNDYLLKTLRSLFFGYEVSKEDKELVNKTFSGKTQLQLALRKKIYALPTDDAPIEYLPDIWNGLEQSVFGQSRDTIYQSVTSKGILVEMLTLTMKLMEDPEGEKVSLDFNPVTSLMSDPLETRLLARIMFMNTIHRGLNMVKVVANQPEESEEDKARRLQKDSSK